MLDLPAEQIRPGQAVRAASRAARTAGPTIWAVASGKGGVGKSVIGSSLAIGLSQTGPRAVAVDLDLGGANLHTLLGCERARHTLSDFAHGRVAALEEALTQTSVPGVRLISGARAGLDLASDQRAQNRRVLRDLARIDAGHVVLDLGAGTGPHTLDAFLAADRRLLVVTPERTAIENAYYFLSAGFFRAFREVARELARRDELASILEQARQRGATPREMVEAASRADARAGERLRTRLRSFQVDLVVNRRDPEQRRGPGAQIAATGRSDLGTNLSYAGSLAEDASVSVAVERGVPVMQLFPGSRFATDVHALIASLFASEPASATRAFALAALPTARASRECRAPTAAAPAPAPGRSAFPGRSLRERREELGLDLAALHERTRIRYRHLEAIEAERFSTLPTEVIVREYVRQIAEALDLADPAGHARLFVEKARASREADRDLPVPKPKSAPAPQQPPTAPRFAVSAAFTRALSRASSAPVAPPPSPTPDELLAGFDYEPEIEPFTADR